MISTIIRDKSVINIYAINIFIILNYYLHKVIIISYYKLCDFPGGSVVKKQKQKQTCLPLQAMQEMQAQVLGRHYPLE